MILHRNIYSPRLKKSDNEIILVLVFGARQKHIYSRSLEKTDDGIIPTRAHEARQKHRLTKT